MLGKGNKLAILFSLVLASSGLLGELTHDHSHEIHDHDAEHHEIEFHNECLTCTSDPVSNELELISYHLFFFNHKEFDQIKSVEENKKSFFLSRAPPK